MKRKTLLGALVLCGSLSVVIAAATSPAVLAGKPVEIAVPSSGGNLAALKYSLPVIEAEHSRTGQVDMIYVPSVGTAWTGGILYGATVAVLEDRILGFRFGPRGNERLVIAVSTNQYALDLENPSVIIQSELEGYRTGRGRYSGDPSYVVRLEDLLGPAAMRDRRAPEWGDTNAFSYDTKPSKLQGITVEGTNAVVAIQIGTNILAKIAFDKNVRPVWATTNGVSIGAIPTNTVHYIGVKPDGHREIRVVY